MNIPWAYNFVNFTRIFCVNPTTRRYPQKIESNAPRIYRYRFYHNFAFFISTLNNVKLFSLQPVKYQIIRKTSPAISISPHSRHRCRGRRGRRRRVRQNRRVKLTRWHRGGERTPGSVEPAMETLGDDSLHSIEGREIGACTSCRTCPACRQIGGLRVWGLIAVPE